MSTYTPAVDRLSRQRLIFARAVADGISMAEAKRRIEADHVELSRRARAEVSRAEVGRWRDADAAPAAAFTPVDDSDDGLQWWQR